MATEIHSTVDLRRKAIGGTDVSAILGMNPWRSAHDVWLEKLGLAETKLANPEAAEWGKILEDPISQKYARETGYRIYFPKPRFIRHPDRSWMGGSPDRLVVGQKRGVDVKTARLADAFKWGDPGTDEVPDAYLIQCHWYLALLDYDIWDIAALLGGQDFRIYEIQRDREFEDMLVRRAEQFWNQYIVARVPPPIDYSVGAERMLQALYPRHGEELLVADAEDERLVSALRVARHNIVAAKQHGDELENRLKERIGEHAGLMGQGWRATWKTPQDKPKTGLDIVNARKEIDWEAVFHALEVPTDHARAVIETYSQPIVRQRRFYFDYRGT